VFERFTQRARQVVVLAQDEARAFRHTTIGTEHILLGLLREEEGLAARVLQSLDITVDEVRAQVVRIAGEGDEVPRGQIPFTPRAKKVLELALREALFLRHNYIGTEHILLGLTRENEGVAAQILLDLGADADKIRNEITRMLDRASRVQPAADMGDLHERYTTRARRVITIAREEAKGLRHDYIGTEHILLGLLDEEEGLAARVLGSLDITVEEVRAQVARIVGRGDSATGDQLPLTPRTKKVLELALREALSLGHNYIGTEHILLGLVREGEGVAARILLDFDADAEKIRNQVIQMLSGPGRRGQAPAPARVPSPRPAIEYRIERWPASGLADRHEALNELGAEGWALAGTISSGDHVQLVFQRPARAVGERGD
jgi:ATP-dependent Clp protease ATP-binding subunit ClpA